jgi:hypothetical protein
MQSFISPNISWRVKTYPSSLATKFPSQNRCRPAILNTKSREFPYILKTFTYMTQKSAVLRKVAVIYV